MKLYWRKVEWSFEEMANFGKIIVILEGFAWNLESGNSMLDDKWLWSLLIRFRKLSESGSI